MSWSPSMSPLYSLFMHFTFRQHFEKFQVRGDYLHLTPLSRTRLNKQFIVHIKCHTGTESWGSTYSITAKMREQTFDPANFKLIASSANSWDTSLRAAAILTLSFKSSWGRIDMLNMKSMIMNSTLSPGSWRARRMTSRLSFFLSQSASSTWKNTKWMLFLMG